MAETAQVSNTPFLWEGTDRNGKKIKGKSLAKDEATVRADLRRQGVVPSRIRKQRQGLFAGGGKITTGDIAIFSRQLATMLAAGIPLVQAFEIVGNGHENAAMQKLILSIKGDVEGGSALAEALAGREEWYLRRQLQNFKSGARGSDSRDTYGLQMAPMAQLLADDQAIADVVAYIATLE